MPEKQPAMAGSPFGSLGSGFANLSAKAKDFGSTVASQVTDMNAKVLAVAESRAANGNAAAGTPAATATAASATSADKPAVAGSTIATASREELVDVLQKMNKKVKILTTLRTQLTEKAQAAEQDRDKLVDIFQNEVLQGVDVSSLDPSMSQADQLKVFWQKKDQQHRDQLDELRSQIKELQSGNGHSVVSVDIVALREQMEQEHNRALEAVKVEHAKEIAQLKEASSTMTATATATVTPAGDTSASEVDTLKQLHEEAMEKLKKAAALQMQNFKKKVAAARTAELEKVVKETREQVTEELTARELINNADDASKFREELENKRLEDLERVKAEMTAQAAKDTEANVNKLLTTMNNQAKEHEEELLRERQSSRQQHEEAQLKINSLQDTVRDSAARLETAKNEMTGQKSAFQAEKEEILKSQKLSLEKQIDAVRAELQKAHADELKAVKNDAESGQSDEVKALRERFAEQAKSFQQRSITEKAMAVEKATIEAQASMNAILEKKDAEHRAQLEEKLNEHNATLAKIRDETAQTFAKAEALSSKLAAAEEQLQQIESDRDKEVQELNENIASLKASAEASALEILSEKEQMQSQLASLKLDKETSEKTVATMKEENKKNMAKLEMSMVPSSESSSSFEARISELEKAVNEKDSELRILKVRFEEDLAVVQGQLSDLEIQKHELEKKLGSTEADLQTKGNDMIAEPETLKTRHAAEKAELKEQLQKDLRVEMEFKLAEEVQRESRKHAEETQLLKNKMADHIDKMNAQFVEKLNAEREQIKREKEELEKRDKKREEQVAKLATQLKGVTEAATKEREEKLSLHKTIKAESGKSQKLEDELAAQKQLLDDAKRESAAASAKDQDALKEANQRLEAEMKSLREDRNISSNKVEELSGKLEALMNNLNSMAEDIKKKDEVLVIAEKQKAKLNSSEKEVSDLRHQINKLKLELTKNTQLANRLQSEKEASERNHGQRTALMGMLEGQLAEVNEKNSDANAKLEAAIYDLSQKEEIVQSLEEKLKETRSALTAAEQKNKESSESLTQAQKGVVKKNSLIAETLQKELQQLQQSTARKSSAAQKLIQEREVECAALRAANKKLQQEVDKGSLSDRKIFELAELQSNRESAQQIEIEVRDNAIERLKKALLDSDGDLASAENTVQEVEAQVEELGRVKRREDVNMDYLKSIIVQYLSKPPGTSERAALLPVLATLLQFDPDDYKLIEDGKKSLTWFGSVEPKVIGGGVAPSSTDIFSSALADFSSYLGATTTATSNGNSTTSPSPAPARVAASAEISVSAAASKPASGSGRTTSLQF